MNTFRTVRPALFARHVRGPLAALFLLIALPAGAAPIHYTIQFTPGQTSTPTGSFDYDGSLPANQQFSNFTVTEAGNLFDFTSVANSFSFRTDAGLFRTSCAGTPTVNDAFEILTKAPCVQSVATLFQWQATGLGNVRWFVFRAQAGATDQFQVEYSASTPYIRDFGDGYVASPSNGVVPEPTSAVLLATGLVGAVCRWRRRKLGATQ